MKKFAITFTLFFLFCGRSNAATISGSSFNTSASNTFSASQTFSTGTAASPSVAIGEPSSGFYYSAAHQVTFAANGSAKLDLMASGFGSATNSDNSGYYFSGGDIQIDSNSGLVKMRNGGSGAILFSADTGATKIVSIPAAGGVSVTAGVLASSFTAVNASNVDAYIAKFSTSSTVYAVVVSTSNHILTSGNPPVISSCGTTPNGSVVGDDNQGIISVGGGAVTACTLTFANPWGTTPNCVITDNSTAVTGDISAISQSAFTASFSVSIGGGKIYYDCGCSGRSCL